MPKFSIVIPVYNVDKYIGRCLDSIFNQTYKDYEVIVVDDGSDDDSKKIVKKYDVKIINSKHQGVSESRNIGAKKANGEYLIFLDSDDYWDKDLLKEINKSLKNNPDLVRFQIRTVTDEGVKTDYNEEPFTGKSGVEAFNIISKYHYVESIWSLAIKREYYEKEKFTFAKDRIHEDFGLTPLVIIKANKVNSIKYIGYNYYRRSGSIMNTPDYSWTQRKVEDFFYNYKILREEINKTDLEKDVFLSFISNSMLMKICELNNKDYKKYLKILREEKVSKDLLRNTIGRKIKGLLIDISPRLYFKIK